MNLFGGFVGGCAIYKVSWKWWSSQTRLRSECWARQLYHTGRTCLAGSGPCKSDRRVSRDWRAPDLASLRNVAVPRKEVCYATFETTCFSTHVVNVDPRDEVKRWVESMGSFAQCEQILLPLRTAGTVSQVSPSDIIALGALQKKRAITRNWIQYMTSDSIQSIPSGKVHHLRQDLN